MTRVRFSPEALRDLEGIGAYIAVENALIAQYVVGRLQMLCFALELAPRLGRPIDIPGVRKLVAPRVPYKIMYEYREESDEAVVLRVYHTSRNT